MLKKMSKSVRVHNVKGYKNCHKSMDCGVVKLLSQRNEKISTEQKLKYCLVLKKISKKCQSVQCKGVEKLSQKYGLLGV